MDSNAHRVIIYIKSLNVLLKVGDVRVSVSGDDIRVDAVVMGR